MNNNIIAQRIKEIRKSLNLTQKALADNTKLAITSISSYEQGTKTPSLPALVSIARETGTSLDWLCGIDDVSKTKKIETFADFIKAFIKIMEPLNYSISIDYKTPLSNVDTKPIAISSNININSTVLANFFSDFNKMKKLVLDDTIDERIFISWLDGQMKRYNTPIFDNTDLPF